MDGYTVVLFIHLLSVLAATSVASLAMLAALRLRQANDATEASAWIALTERVVPAFPVAVLGLLVTGGWMTHARWSWTTPWIDAALVGLGLLVVLGNGIEGTRLRALKRELAAAGLSVRAQRMVRDPVLWSAKMTTLTLVVAVVLVMTVKPAGPECAAVIAGAVLVGVLAAVPLWRTRVRAIPAGVEGVPELAGRVEASPLSVEVPELADGPAT